MKNSFGGLSIKCGLCYSEKLSKLIIRKSVNKFIHGLFCGRQLLGNRELLFCFSLYWTVPAHKISGAYIQHRSDKLQFIYRNICNYACFIFENRLLCNTTR